MSPIENDQATNKCHKLYQKSAQPTIEMYNSLGKCTKEEHTTAESVIMKCTNHWKKCTNYPGSVHADH